MLSTWKNFKMKFDTIFQSCNVQGPWSNFWIAGVKGMSSLGGIFNSSLVAV